MISTLSINRFKSIRELSLNCRRINIFIGEPNTGKSNILEALGMFSWLYYSLWGYNARQFVRFERTSNLFHDENLDDPVAIKCGPLGLEVAFKDGGFQGALDESGKAMGGFRGDYNDFVQPSLSSSSRDRLASFKFYRFTRKENFPRKELDFLMPPSGENLLSLLLGSKELRSIVNQPFLDMGLRLGIRQQENKLEVIKQVEDIIISYPYSLTSETLQRFTFYLAAILSNKSSVLVFEEPESHAFPYYTKQLAELIALDKRDNQYFISTHNPYFLLPVLEKAPKDDIAVYIVYFQDYETKTKQLTEEELSEIAEIDIFSNLERYLEAK